MRFALSRPINGGREHRKRDILADAIPVLAAGNPQWTRRFVRNRDNEGAAHGAISPTPSLALRTIGENFRRILSNLYMPEELLRNRNRYERRVYKHEPSRSQVLVQLKLRVLWRASRAQDARFRVFHNAVTPNLVTASSRPRIH